MSLAVEKEGGPEQTGVAPTSGPLPVTQPASSLPYDGKQIASLQRPNAVESTPVGVRHHRHSLLQAFQSLVYVIVIALFIITFIAQPFRIPSESMVPTLLVGDFLLVDKEIGLEVPPRVIAPTSVIQRGDLVVFHYPVDSSLHLVKRVVGLPGDRLRLRDGHVYIDGRALSEPYAIFRPAAPDRYRDDFPRMSTADPGVDSRWWIQMRSLVSNGELTVPADSYFVLGDNRNDSEDSRYWGFVPRAAIVGKPFLIYFSLKNADSTPGALAAAEPAGAGSKHDPSLASVVDFARWDRLLRVIY
jgi:signal peptidase I